MVDGDTTLDIEIERAPLGAKPFIPEEDKKRVEFELEPEAVPEEELAPYVPFPTRWKPPPLVAARTRALLVDIEATGLMPWDSRLMLIGVKDLLDPMSRGIQFYSEDEETLLRDFITFFKDGRYEEIVAYNLPYDMRYIFAKCMRYGLPIKALIDAEWTDLAWRMQQVKRHSSAIRQKPGKLDDWTMFFFGEGKLMSYKELLEAWGKGDIDSIREYNLKDLDLTAKLWMLSEFVMTGDPWTPETQEVESDGTKIRKAQPEGTGKKDQELPRGAPTPVEGYKKVVSRGSLAEQWIPSDATKYIDYLTGDVETI